MAKYASTVILPYLPDGVVLVAPSGPPGPVTDIVEGTTTTLAPGSAATVSLTGSFPTKYLNLGLPAGVTGGVATVAGVSPDGGGNVPLTPAEIGAASTSALSTETSRAEAAESAETTRAEGVEATNAAAVATERTRAEAAETANVTSNGYGLQKTTGRFDVTLTTAAVTLGSNTTVTTGGTVLLTTPSLAVGTWLISASVLMTASTNLALDAHGVVASGTATLSGNTAGSVYSTNASLTMSFLAVVTAAAVITIKAISGTTGVTVLAASTNSSYAGATGLTAVRIT